MAASAAYSIEVIQKGLHEKANVEDFHFATQFEASKRSIAAVEETGRSAWESSSTCISIGVRWLAFWC